MPGFLLPVKRVGGEAMTTITIKDLPDATYRALEKRAARHGRSIEAEIHHIIENAMHSPKDIRLGTELAAIGRQIGGVELDITRDKTPLGQWIFNSLPRRQHTASSLTPK